MPPTGGPSGVPGCCTCTVTCETNTTVCITVLDEVTGSPVSGASVTAPLFFGHNSLFSGTYTTDALGTVCIAVTTGTRTDGVSTNYYYKVSKAGYVDQCTDVAIGCTDTSLTSTTQLHPKAPTDFLCCGPDCFTPGTNRVGPPSVDVTFSITSYDSGGNPYGPFTWSGVCDGVALTGVMAGVFEYTSRAGSTGAITTITCAGVVQTYTFEALRFYSCASNVDTSGILFQAHNDAPGAAGYQTIPTCGSHLGMHPPVQCGTAQSALIVLCRPVLYSCSWTTSGQVPGGSILTPGIFNISLTITEHSGP